VPLVLDVAAALEHAHAAGLVNRDVKPANILIDHRGVPKLTDFDLVRAADTTGGTRTGMMGSFIYAAPEMLEAAMHAGPAADVFSLAMTALFCLHENDLPPEAFRRPDRFMARLSCEKGLKEVLLRAIEEDPSRRFPTMSDFRVAVLRASSKRTIP
jgi:serine/threonine protein kinase